MVIRDDTKEELAAQAKAWGQISWDSETNAQLADQRTSQMLQLIVATREYHSPNRRNLFDKEDNNASN
jgi:hypothetical protein